METVNLSAIRTDGGTQPRAGVVYAIQRGHSGGAIKVGFTAENVFARIRSLQTGSAEMLVPISWTPGTPLDERVVHDALDDFRMTGEWFFPARKVLNAARDLSAFLATLTQSSGLIPDLMAAYEVDGAIVPTASLTEAAVHRLLNRRRQRETRERSMVNDIEGAVRILGPIWRRHPELTLEQAEQYLLQHGVGAAA